MFEKGTKEYEELEYRILCGQLYQQNELDKLKGVVAKSMPKSWINRGEAIKEGKENIVANRKPYFMIYIYKKLMKEYKKYVRDCNDKCFMLFGMYIDELESLEFKDCEQMEFLKWYELKKPVGESNCTMNRICKAVENEMEGYSSKLKTNNEFDYSFMKYGRNQLNKNKEVIKEIYEEYKQETINFSKNNNVSKLSKDESRERREALKLEYKNKVEEVCLNKEQRLDIILDMCYTNKNSKQFCWDVCSELIIERLEILNDNN